MLEFLAEAFDEAVVDFDAGVARVAVDSEKVEEVLVFKSFVFFDLLLDRGVRKFQDFASEHLVRK